MPCQCRLLYNIHTDFASCYDLPDCWLPHLTKDAQKLFQEQRDSWWSKFSTIQEFSKKMKPPFAHRVATDGTSVSVLFERTSAAAAADDQADAALDARNNPATAAIADKNWVRGPDVTSMPPPQRVVGVDPGAKAVFTAVVHSARAEQTLSDPRPDRYRSHL